MMDAPSPSDSGARGVSLCTDSAVRTVSESLRCQRSCEPAEDIPSAPAGGRSIPSAPAGGRSSSGGEDGNAEQVQAQVACSSSSEFSPVEDHSAPSAGFVFPRPCAPSFDSLLNLGDPSDGYRSTDTFEFEAALCDSEPQSACAERMWRPWTRISGRMTRKFGSRSRLKPRGIMSESQRKGTVSLSTGTFSQPLSSSPQRNEAQSYCPQSDDHSTPKDTKGFKVLKKPRVLKKAGKFRKPRTTPVNESRRRPSKRKAENGGAAQVFELHSHSNSKQKMFSTFCCHPNEEDPEVLRAPNSSPKTSSELHFLPDGSRRTTAVSRKILPYAGEESGTIRSSESDMEDEWLCTYDSMEEIPQEVSQQFWSLHHEDNTHCHTSDTEGIIYETNASRDNADKLQIIESQTQRLSLEDTDTDFAMDVCNANIEATDSVYLPSRDSSSLHCSEMLEDSVFLSDEQDERHTPENHPEPQAQPTRNSASRKFSRIGKSISLAHLSNEEARKVLDAQFRRAAELNRLRYGFHLNAGKRAKSDSQPDTLRREQAQVNQSLLSQQVSMADNRCQSPLLVPEDHEVDRFTFRRVTMFEDVSPPSSSSLESGSWLNRVQSRGYYRPAPMLDSICLESVSLPDVNRFSPSRGTHESDQRSCSPTSRSSPGLKASRSRCSSSTQESPTNMDIETSRVRGQNSCAHRPCGQKTVKDRRNTYTVQSHLELPIGTQDDAVHCDPPPSTRELRTPAPDSFNDNLDTVLKKQDQGSPLRSTLAGRSALGCGNSGDVRVTEEKSDTVAADIYTERAEKYITLNELIPEPSLHIGTAPGGLSVPRCNSNNLQFVLRDCPLHGDLNLGSSEESSLCNEDRSSAGSSSSSDLSLGGSEKLRQQFHFNSYMYNILGCEDGFSLFEELDDVTTEHGIRVSSEHDGIIADVITEDGFCVPTEKGDIIVDSSREKTKDGENRGISREQSTQNGETHSMPRGRLSTQRLDQQGKQLGDTPNESREDWKENCTGCTARCTTSEPGRTCANITTVRHTTEDPGDCCADLDGDRVVQVTPPHSLGHDISTNILQASPDMSGSGPRRPCEHCKATKRSGACRRPAEQTPSHVTPRMTTDRPRPHRQPWKDWKLWMMEDIAEPNIPPNGDMNDGDDLVNDNEENAPADDLEEGSSDSSRSEDGCAPQHVGSRGGHRFCTLFLWACLGLWVVFVLSPEGSPFTWSFITTFSFWVILFWLKGRTSHTRSDV